MHTHPFIGKKSKLLAPKFTVGEIATLFSHSENQFTKITSVMLPVTLEIFFTTILALFELNPQRELLVYH